MSKFGWFALVLLVLAADGSTLRRSAYARGSDADLIRETELQRLRALVEANIDVARRLHADDFQLINPRGESLSKEQYLGAIASGQIDYLVWEPESPIEVRVYGLGAVIRYRSRLEIVVQGEKVPLQRYWHTDSYEKRNGRWQVVWSQATGVRLPPQQGQDRPPANNGSQRSGTDRNQPVSHRQLAAG